MEKYRNEVIKKNGDHLEFSKNISVACFAEAFSTNLDVVDASVYLFQTISCGNEKFNLFYDNGCGDMIITKDALERLQRLNRAVVIDPTPKLLTGVNNQTSNCEHGMVQIKLVLKNGEDTKLSGICLNDITRPFLKYPLSAVEKDIVLKLICM